MRLIALMTLMSIVVFAQGFPKVFSSAGDHVYESMNRYLKIKDLPIYADRPELLEAFCNDANASMQKGYRLDAIQEDPEAPVDKDLIKSYAKELRRLSTHNEAIENELKTDIKKLYEAKDFKSLAVFKSSGIQLSNEINVALQEHQKKIRQAEELAIVLERSKKAAEEQALEKQQASALKKTPAKVVQSETKKEKAIAKSQVSEPLKKSAEVSTLKQSAVKVPQQEQVQKKVKEIEEQQPQSESAKVASAEPRTDAEEPVSKPEVVTKELTKLEYYEQNLVRLKEELYELRESGDQSKTACLNDITAMNYWMI